MGSIGSSVRVCHNAHDKKKSYFQSLKGCPHFGGNPHLTRTTGRTFSSYKTVSEQLLRHMEVVK